jgi:hypothetical protein
MPAFATISQVQSAAKWTCGTSNQTVTCVINTNVDVSSNNLLAVWTFWESSNGGAPYPYTAGVDDNGTGGGHNNWYSAVGPTLQLAASTPTTAQLFYAKKINASTGGSGGDPIKVTYSCLYSLGPPVTGNPACTLTPSITLAGVVVVEYSGLDTTYPLDSISAGYSSSATSLLDSGTVPPANSNLELFAGGVSDGGTAVPGTGFTSIQSHNFSSGMAITEQNTNAITGNNVLQRATACLGSTVPCPATPTGNWVMQMAVFRAASANVFQGWSPAQQQNVVYADQYSGGIQAAINALPSVGGEARTPAHYRETITTIPVDVGSSTPQAVRLGLNGDSQITCNSGTIAGAFCLDVYKGSSLFGTPGVGGNTGNVGGATIQTGSSFNNGGLVMNDPNDSFFAMSNVTLDCRLGTVTDSCAKIRNIFAPAYLRDNIIAGQANSKAFYMTGVTTSDGTKLDGSNGIILENNWITCSGSAGCAPVIMEREWERPVLMPSL